MSSTAASLAVNSSDKQATAWRSPGTARLCRNCLVRNPAVEPCTSPRPPLPSATSDPSDADHRMMRCQWAPDSPASRARLPPGSINTSPRLWSERAAAERVCPGPLSPPLHPCYVCTVKHPRITSTAQSLSSSHATALPLVTHITAVAGLDQSISQ